MEYAVQYDQFGFAGERERERERERESEGYRRWSMLCNMISLGLLGD
jgi:hypothetical protein